jgi:hypothetical protein
MHCIFLWMTGLDELQAVQRNRMHSLCYRLTELHADTQEELRKELEIAGEQLERWIGLLDQGIMQNHQDTDGSLHGGLVDLTLMTSAHLGLRELMQEMDDASSDKITLQQSHMLQTGNTVVQNMGTVAHAVSRFHVC